MNDTTMTVVGNVVEDPRLRVTKNGHCVANFRVASTARRFDRDQGRFVDGSTLFVTVQAWRALAENIAASLRKGQPVMVHGRYFQREYEENEVKKLAYVLEATAVGHDLTRGTAAFERKYRAPGGGEIATDSEGRPIDASVRIIDDLVEDAEPHGGRPDDDADEMRELAAVFAAESPVDADPFALT